MPSVSLSPSSIQFPDDFPGDINSATPSTVTATVTETVASLTIAIADAPAGVFSAQLVSTEVGHNIHGGPSVSTTVLASTDGSEAGTYNSPIPPCALTINIRYAAPSSPVPQAIQGTLNVTWPGGGSASVGLLLYVSQIIPSVGTNQPIRVKAGGDSVQVPIDITYQSYDPAVLQVNVASTNYPPPTAGLTIGPGQAQLPPTYGSQHWPFKALDPERTATVKLPVSAATSAVPGKASAYYNVTAPDFPLLYTANYEIAFEIMPRPVNVTVTTPSLSFATNESATLGLTIATDGAAGELNFGTPSATYTADSTPAGIDIAGGNYYFGGPDGQSVATSARITTTTKKEGLVKVTVPYSAYNGLFKSSISFEVTLLAPDAYVFSIGKINVVTQRSADFGETDSDYLTLCVAVGSNPLISSTISLGDHTYGDVFDANLSVAAEVADDDRVVMCYIMNNQGYTDTDEAEFPLAVAAKFLAQAAIAAYAAGAADVSTLNLSLPGFGNVLVPPSGSALTALGNWLLSYDLAPAPDTCDGPVAAGIHAFTGAQLRRGIVATDSCAGINSPAGCGSNSLYEVTWAISVQG
jgi:hypothetical protein